MESFRSVQHDEVDHSAPLPASHDRVLANLAADLQRFRATRPSDSPNVSILNPSAPDTTLRPETLQGTHEPKAPEQTATAGVLSSGQADLLRQVILGGELATDDLDGRSVRALKRRGLVVVEGDRVRATEAGEEYFEQRVRKRRRARFAREIATGPADRAEAIDQAVRMLESVLPRTQVHRVGDLPADTAELLAGLVEYAQQLRSGLVEPEE